MKVVKSAKIYGYGGFSAVAVENPKMPGCYDGYIRNDLRGEYVEVFGEPIVAYALLSVEEALVAITMKFGVAYANEMV